MKKTVKPFKKLKLMTNFIKKINLPIIVCITACITVCFSGIADHDLWTPDEPRVAAISLEMAESGDIIIPRLGGDPFIEKPPLHFAVSALMIRLFGHLIGNTNALRLTSALFGLGVLIFTFMIARKTGGNKTGIESALILGTMIGFIQNYHWIRVDTSLSFFVIISLWCFIEAYYENRPGFLFVGGIFTGLAFLSKGLIGPVLIAVPWTGLFIFWISQFNKNRLNIFYWTWFHLFCLLAFSVICGIWIIQLQSKGGEQLWHEWFWVNHFGRFAGTAVGKGHLKEGQPFYYLVQLVINGMPWTPLFFFWFIDESKKFIKTRVITGETFFLFIWGIGSLLLLSIPTTKRGLYLLPVLPAFAIMAGSALQSLEIDAFYKKWFKRYSTLWISLCAALVTIITFLPVIAKSAGDNLPEKVLNTLISPEPSHWVLSFGSLFFLILIVFGLKKHFSIQYRTMLATAIFFLAVFGLPFKAVDTAKSMGKDINHFVASIPREDRGSIAGTNFSETMLGSVYYYTGWKVPQVNEQTRIQAILENRDPEYRSLLVNSRKVKNKETDLAKFKYQVINSAVTSSKRGLFLIKGADKHAE